MAAVCKQHERANRASFMTRVGLSPRVVSCGERTSAPAIAAGIARRNDAYDPLEMAICLVRWTRPKYRSSQLSLPLIRWCLGTLCPPSKRTRPLCSLGVPRRRWNGSLDFSRGIRNRRGRRRPTWEYCHSGSKIDLINFWPSVFGYKPGPIRTLTLRRSSIAGRIAPIHAPQL